MSTTLRIPSSPVRSQQPRWEGIQSKGVYVYIKHFALNDTESRCRCIATFASEQAIREVYLKSFEMALPRVVPSVS